jgi:transposase InsO family protein
VNRKRVQRLMREHALLQPKRSEGRRRRPGYFQVTRPDELWHLDMTSVWVAEHGWCYLNAAIDCCTREIVGWALDVRCRAAEATAVIDAALADRRIGPGELTLGTDNGTAFTSRAFRARLAEDQITHRRGGYRDPESQAFIESWFAKLKQRCIRREKFDSRDEARHAIGAYVDSYHHRPHQGASPTGPRARSRPPGRITETSQSQRPDRQHRRGPRHTGGLGARRLRPAVARASCTDSRRCACPRGEAGVGRALACRPGPRGRGDGAPLGAVRAPRRLLERGERCEMWHEARLRAAELETERAIASAQLGTLPDGRCQGRSKVDPSAPVEN